MSDPFTTGTEGDATERPLVVVADGDEHVRHEIAAALHPEFRVQPVAGADALTGAVAVLTPDVVLVGDVEDALTLVRDLTARDPGGPAPVLAMGGHDAVEAMLAAGAPDGLVRPFTRSELRARVRARAELTRLRARAAAPEVQESASRMRAAIDAAGSGIALGDVHGGITQANPALCSLLLRSEEQLLGRTVHDLAHEDDLPFLTEVRNRLLRGEIDSAAVETRLVRSDGAAVWVHLEVALVFDGARRPSQWMLSVQDISERKRCEGQLRVLADHDPLTGLLNRRRFAEEFDRVLAECARHGHDAALVLLDVDGLEQVNETHGHVSGDQVLAGVADLVRGRLRETDVAARLSGDEFVLLLPRTDAASAMRLTEELLSRIRQGAPVLSGAGAQVTASAGVARARSGEMVASTHEVFLQADDALYAAKRAGRDQVHLATDEAAGRWRPRRRREVQIRQALAADGLELHAQPILGLATDRRARHELLLRLRADDGTLVAPGAFLIDAERTDLILDIDRWVITRGCEMLADHQRVDPDLVFHLNLSARTITHPEIPGLIASELRRTGAAGSGLVFEITETSAITSIDRARALSDSLRVLGCGLALDDFGAGFASFTYLKHLDFDYVKIDGELIRDVARDRRDERILSCIVDLANALEKHSIAECVADQETLDLVTAYDVDYAQGFHIARPAPLTVTC